VGGSAIERSAQDVEKAAAAVKFLEHRSPAAHHLALVGLYRRWWPTPIALDKPPEALVTTPAAVAPALAPHYWRVFGYWASRSWYNNERSLSLLHAHLHAFVPRLDPSVQRAFLQGVGELLFDFIYTRSVAPADLERFPRPYQESLLEGWGMALGEAELPYPYYSTGHESLSWIAATKGFSARSLVSVQQGKAQFEVLFEGAALSAPGLPLRP
jgi:hypothetical protein